MSGFLSPLTQHTCSNDGTAPSQRFYSHDSAVMSSLKFLVLFYKITSSFFFFMHVYLCVLSVLICSTDRDDCEFAFYMFF